MRYQDIRDAVLQSTPSRDWRRLARRDLTVIFYANDVRIRLESADEEEDERTFTEPWTQRFPDKTAFRHTYYLYYGQTLLDETLLVGVDGGRVQIPLPELSEKRFDRFDYKVAEIVHATAPTTYNFRDYIGRAGLGDYDYQTSSE